MFGLLFQIALVATAALAMIWIINNPLVVVVILVFGWLGKVSYR